MPEQIRMPKRYFKSRSDVSERLFCLKLFFRLRWAPRRAVSAFRLGSAGIADGEERQFFVQNRFRRVLLFFGIAAKGADAVFL